MDVATTASCILDSLLVLSALSSFLYTTGGFRAHIEDTDSWGIHNNVTHRLNHNKSESAQIHRKLPPGIIFSTPANALPISMPSPLPPISLPKQPINLMSMCISPRRRKNCNHHSGSVQTMVTTTLYSC